MERIRRRQFLAAAGGSGVLTTAGCTIPILDGGNNEGEQSTGEWTQLRGNAGMTGHSGSSGPGPDATQQFTAEFRDGIDQTNSAPLIGDDGIYGVGKVAKTYETEPYTFGGYAFKCSREDGSEVWRQEIAIREGQENLGFFRDTPHACLGPSGLYVLWTEERGAESDGPRFLVHVERRSREDGSVQWNRTIEGVPVLDRQPVVRGDTLYVLARAKLWAFAIEDGSDRWQSEVFGDAQPAPSVGQDVVAVYNRGFRGDDEDVTMQLTAFDRSDGSERWSVPTPKTAGAAKMPSVAGETVFIAEGYGLYSFGVMREEYPARSIRALDASDGSERWSYTYADASEERTMAGGTTSVAVDSDTVYVGLFHPTASLLLDQDASEAEREQIEEQVYTGRNILALNRADGSLKWDAQVGTEAQVFPYLVVDDTNLYARYLAPRDGNAGPQSQWYVVEKSSGEIRSSFGSDVEYEGFRAFGVADGALYEHVGTGVRVWE